MADLFDNPMGLDGFEFVEFASPEPKLLETVFHLLGFEAVARHRSKDVTLFRQGLPCPECVCIIALQVGIPGVVPSSQYRVDGCQQAACKDYQRDGPVHALVISPHRSALL